MKLDGDICVEDVKTCLLCGSHGVPLYAELRDQLYSVPGAWSYVRCPRDGHLWISPRPVIEDIGRAYTTYFTHDSSAAPRPMRAILREAAEHILREQTFGGPARLRRRRMLAWGIRLLPMVEELARSRMMWLTRHDGPKLVDVGCGQGDFLMTMQHFGWDCAGVELDATAAAIARQRSGSQVTVGRIEDSHFPSESIDAITANHTIEHLHDPIAFLRESFRILRPGGKLVVVTPNSTSLGHRLFRESWRGLEPPRHLHLFCTKTMRICAEQVGFAVQTLRTTACPAVEIWCFSRLIQRKIDLSIGLARHLTLSLRVEALAFQLFEHLLRPVWSEIGEGLLLIACKPGPTLTSSAERAAAPSSSSTDAPSPQVSLARWKRALAGRDACNIQDFSPHSNRGCA